MAENEVNIVVNGEDKASPAINKAAEAGKGLGGMFDGATAKAGKLGDILGGALKVGALASGAGLIGAGLAMKDFIGEAMASQEVMAQTNAVLASTHGAAGMSADAVSDLATKLSRIAPVDDEAIQSAENLLLTFTSIGKDVFPQATETVLDMSQALGQDLKSSAIQLGKAMNDPITGATALRRVGVALTEQQMTQIKAFQESGNLMGAQSIIMKELQTEFGGSARAAGDTFAGKMKILNTQIGNVKESIGLALLPMLAKLADLAVQYVVPAIEDSVAALSDFAEVIKSGDIAGAAEAFNRLPGPMQEIAIWLGKNKEAIEGFVRAAADIATSISLDVFEGWKRILEALGPKLVEFGQFLGDHKPLLIALAVALGVVVVALIGIPAAIAAVIVGVGLLAANWDTIKAKTIEIWNAIDDAVGGALSDIVGVVGAQFDVIRALVETQINIIRDIVKIVMAVLRGDWSAAWDGIKQLVSDILTGIVAVVTAQLDLMKAQLQLAWDVIKIVAAAAWDWLKTTVGSALGAMRDMVNYGLEFIKNTFVNGFGWLQGAVGAIWSGIEDAIVEPIKRIINWIQRVIDKAHDLANIGGLAGSLIRKAADLVGFADGGVSMGGLAVVGERGPELVNLPAGAQVHSNADSQRMLAGREVTVQFNGPVTIQAQDALAAERSTSNIGWAIAQGMRARGVWA